MVRILNTNEHFDDKGSKKKVNFNDTAEYKVQNWCLSLKENETSWFV